MVPGCLFHVDLCERDDPAWDSVGSSIRWVFRSMMCVITLGTGDDCCEQIRET